MTVTPSRDEEIRLIWKENQWLYMVVGFIAGLLFCLLTQLSIPNLPDLVKDLLPEAAGILVTITVIDQLNRRRDERNAIKQLQEQLVRDASSIVNDVANNAIHQIRKRDWLEGDGGLLKGADLREANLQGADLSTANLQRTKFYMANLQGANLALSKLQGTDLYRAKLQGAYLIGSKLQGANLSLAKLQRADLIGAEFDENTILPDNSHWIPDTDMTRFTQPDNQAGSS
jgi:hypothetical protein